LFPKQCQLISKALDNPEMKKILGSHSDGYEEFSIGT
jgi:hypothetical protein